MKKTAVLGLGMIIFLWVSCPAGSNRSDENDMSEYPGISRNTGLQEAEEKDPSAETTAEAVQPRVRIKTGRLTLLVADVKQVEQTLQASAEDRGGFVFQSKLGAHQAVITLKIPEDRFEDFLTVAERFGTLKKKEIQTEDVTDQYYDLENRIKNKKILLERYQAYLKGARTVQELLDLERAVNDVVTEIERLEGSFRSLAAAVNFSTVIVTLELPPEMKPVIQTPSLGESMRTFGEFLLAFLHYFLLMVLYILAVMIPLVLFGAFIYFIGFGRVGLVVKLFRALSARKKTNQS